MGTRRLPVLPVLPRRPDFSAGRCCSPGADRGWWTSHDQREREAAIWACKSCPVLAACREWAMSSLPIADTAVYAAMTANERIQARRRERSGRRSGTGPQRLRLRQPGCLCRGGCQC
ncbi:MAG TPA: hypothetical protein DHU96_09480 [Actinobacteria bacterium]|nr:hypothetical protein [Actinomycetota bacterium]